MAAIGPCQAVILALNNSVDVPFLDGIGGLRALRDPASMGMSEIAAEFNRDGGVAVDGSGNPVVTVKYFQSSTAASLTTPDCEGDPAPEPKSMDVALDMYRQRPGVDISVPRIQSLCGEAAAFADIPFGEMPNTVLMNDFAKLFRMEVRRLMQDIDTSLVTRLVTRVGFNANMAVPAATAKSLTVFNADGSLNQMGYAEMQHDWEFNELSGRPIILGGSRVSIAQTILGWGCCSNSGVDFNAVRNSTQQDFYFDKAVNTVMAPDEFLAWAPGAAVALNRSKWKIQGVDSYRLDNTTFGQFTLPEFPGWVFDLRVVEAGCVSPGYNFIISASYGLFTAPTDVFRGTDPIAGVNQILRYKAATAA